MVIRTWRDLSVTLVWTMEVEIEDFLRSVDYSEQRRPRTARRVNGQGVGATKTWWEYL